MHAGTRNHKCVCPALIYGFPLPRGRNDQIQTDPLHLTVEPRSQLASALLLLLLHLLLAALVETRAASRDEADLSKQTFFPRSRIAFRHVHVQPCKMYVRVLNESHKSRQSMRTTLTTRSLSTEFQA